MQNELDSFEIMQKVINVVQYHNRKVSLLSKQLNEHDLAIFSDLKRTRFLSDAISVGKIEDHFNDSKALP